MANNYGTGIPLATGFDLSAAKALDHRTVKSSLVERDAMSDELYEGIIVYVEETKTNYQLVSLNSKTWEVLGKSGGSDNPVNPDNFTKVVPVTKGGTGANTAANARANLEVPSVKVKIEGKNGLKGGGDLSSNREISHGDKPTNGSKLSATEIQSGTKILASVTIDEYGHVVSVEQIDVTKLVTWDFIKKLFGDHKITLGEGTVSADNLVTYTRNL